MDWIELKREFKTLRIFYGLYFISGLSAVLAPFWVIYFRGIGLSFTEIGLLLAVGPIMAIIFEVPTGAIADTYGRKVSVGLAWLFAGTLFSLIFFVTDFWILFLIYAILGVTTTLQSGADEAWLVDFLKWKKKSKYMHSAFSRRDSIGAFGIILAALIGSAVVASLGLQYLWLFAGALSLSGATYIFIFGKEEFKERPSNIKKAMTETWDNTKNGFKYSRRHPVIFWLLVFTLYMSLLSFTRLIWQPLFVDLGLSVEYLGLVFASAGIIGVIVPNLSKKFLEKVKKEKYAMIVSEVIYFIIFISFYYFFNLWMALSIFLILAIVDYLNNPLRAFYFQRHVPSKQRATIGSIGNWMSAIGAAISLVIGGYVIDIFGFQAVILILAASAIPAILILKRIRD